MLFYGENESLSPGNHIPGRKLLSFPSSSFGLGQLQHRFAGASRE